MNPRRSVAGPLAVLLGASLILAGCGTSCPVALLTGDLVRNGDELVVANPNGGSVPPERLRWPAGHRLEQRDGRLVDVDFFGTVQAGEGDSVRLGGGEGQTGVWGVCGLIEVAGRPS